jgi:hypothetical protein
VGCRAQSTARSELVFLCSERQTQYVRQLGTPLENRSSATATECWRVYRIENHATLAHSTRAQKVSGPLVHFLPKKSVVEVDRSFS